MTKYQLTEDTAQDRKYYPCPGVDSYDPRVSRINVVFFHITSHSVLPSQYYVGLPPGLFTPTSIVIISYCGILVVSSRYVAKQLKAFMDDTCRYRLDHCISHELFVSDYVFPGFALNPS